MERPLYNQLVSYYELVEGRDWDQETRLIVSVLRDHFARSVIDLGCGTGYHVRALAKLGFKTTGVDISKRNVLFARKKAAEEHARPSFVVGDYYQYSPRTQFDCALCLNWSIPVRDNDVRHFLRNTRRLLQRGGLLVFDFEKVSEIKWSDVGKVMTESWTLGNELIARVSVGRVISNILYSTDVYMIYPKSRRHAPPNERSRYEIPSRRPVGIHVDSSVVRFFSIAEIRKFALKAGFKINATYALPRKKYRRNYVVLQKVR